MVLLVSARVYRCVYRKRAKKREREEGDSIHQGFFADQQKRKRKKRRAAERNRITQAFPFFFLFLLLFLWKRQHERSGWGIRIVPDARGNEVINYLLPCRPTAFYTKPLPLLLSDRLTPRNVIWRNRPTCSRYHDIDLNQWWPRYFPTLLIYSITTREKEMKASSWCGRYRNELIEWSGDGWKERLPTVIDLFPYKKRFALLLLLLGLYHLKRKFPPKYKIKKDLLWALCV